MNRHCATIRASLACASRANIVCKTTTDELAHLVDDEANGVGLGFIRGFRGWFVGYVIKTSLDESSLNGIIE